MPTPPRPPSGSRRTAPPGPRGAGGRPGGRPGAPGDYDGGAAAGPVFKDVMSFAMRGLAIPPTGTRPTELQLFAPGSGPKSAR